jgi:hypothetical protein
MPAGRPTDYQPEYAAQAHKLCLLLGATDKQLAEFFDVSEQTINAWKHSFPAFLESIHAGKRIADGEVAHSLFNRAKGAQYVSNQVIKVKRVEYDEKGKKTLEKEEVVIIPVETVEPPDTTACSFWLKNRQPKEWRDKNPGESAENPVFVRTLSDFYSALPKPKEDGQ